MTPKEKAIELVEKFKWYCEGAIEYQQAIASIAVDEILNSIQDLEIADIKWDYWQEVKQEIENL